MSEKTTYEELKQRVRELEQAESERKRAEGAPWDSAEHLSATLRSIGDGVISCNTDNTVASLNAVAEKLTGWTAVEAEGEPIDAVFNIVNTQTGEKAENPVERSLKEGTVVGLANHTMLISKDGTAYQIADSCAPVKGKDGKILGCVLVFRDVTREYEQREALRKNEALLKGIFNSVQDGMIVLDQDLNILTVNQTINKWYASNTPLKGKKCYECYHNANNPCDPCPTQRCMKTGQVEREIVKGPSGSSVQWLELFSYPMWDDRNEKITGAVEFVRDITSRKDAENALRKSEERFRFLSNDLPALICEFLPDTTLTFVNHAYCNFFGMSEEELVGRSFLDLIPEESREDTKKQFSSLTMQKPVKTYTHEVIKNGNIAWQEWRDRAVFDDRGEVVKYHSIGIDISGRKEAEESLRESEKFLSGLLNNLRIFIGVLEPDGKVIFANNKALDVAGIELGDVAGKMFYDGYWWAYSGEAKQTIKQDIEACASGEIVFREIEIQVAGGSLMWIELSLYPIYNDEGKIEYLVPEGRDITERKQAEAEREKLQAQLNQAQKMEAIGTLAGGIAHNFNNILMGVQGRTSLMMVDKEPSDPDYEHLIGIEEYIKNAVELTSDLLGFARGGKYEVKPTDLNALIKHENRMFGNTRKEIRVQEKYEKDLWTVKVDHGQIRQVLLNLYVNAWQAMPGGGDLYIQTGNIILDEEYIKPFAVAPGRYVKVSVTDTGMGMDAATREKIFDPFFTTKDAAQGSGLGLASVYGIIKNHGGYINVYSEKGEGTTFNIYLPASEKETMEQAPRPDRHEVQYGRGTVLLVDDEEMIIGVGQAMLEKLGYRALTAKSGQEALDLYEKQKGEIDLVILDIIMPDMGGSETFNRLKAIDGNVRVLLSSGYSINGQATEIMNRGCVGFIQKPFSIKDLSIEVREALDEGKSDT